MYWCAVKKKITKFNLTIGKRDVDTFLQPPPQCLVDVPRKICSSKDHNDLRRVFILSGRTRYTWSRKIFKHKSNIWCTSDLKQNDPNTLFERLTVHLYKELSLDAPARLVFVLPTALGTDGINFVKEDGAWCIKLGLMTRIRETFFNLNLLIESYL